MTERARARSGRRLAERERVEVAIVGGGPAGAVLAARLAGAGRRGRRPRTVAGLALARRRGLHVAGGRRGARAGSGWTRRRWPRSRDRSRRCGSRPPAGTAVPADLRRRDRRRARRRVRSVAARPGSCSSGPPRPAPTSGAAGTSPTVDLGDGHARGARAGRATRRRPRVGHRRRRRAALGRGPGGRRRAPGPARPADRADLPPPRPGPGAAAATPGCASCATATSGSRRSPAVGSTSGSCSAGRGGRRSPATARGPSRTAIVAAHPADRRRPGDVARRRADATRSRAPGRSATA